MQLWEAEADGEFRDDKGLKGGCTKLTTLRQIPMPTLTTTQRVRFAILCGLKVGADQVCPEWGTWANAWLKGDERSESAAEAAEAAWSAARAAEAAALAAWSAAEAARAAEAAARSAEAAALADFSLVELLEQAIKEEQS